MIDINFIRNNLEVVKKSAENKGVSVDLEKLLQLDDQRRELISRVDSLRTERNQVAQERNIKRGREIKGELEGLEKQLAEKQKQWKEAMYQVPNITMEGVPEGDASHNEVIKREGEPKKFDFTPKDHVELGEILDIIDIPRAAKVSGTRFAYLKNEGVILELALVQYAIQTLIKEGFTPLIPPALIKKEITDGLGYWHGRINKEHTANENYYLVYDPEETENSLLYLIGTGEHVTVPIHSEEILDGKELPKKYAAFSPCFRREVGSYGKDVRGILRVHQFDKVEMVEFVKPQDDETERRKMLALAENFMKLLGLPYQLVKLASGDLAFPTAETIDIETWVPSQNQYRETHSISTTTDFQARRLDIKYKEGGKTEFVHILNGTAFAIGRIIIAILENFQQADGTVIIPEVLRPFTGFSEIKPK